MSSQSTALADLFGVGASTGVPAVLVPVLPAPVTPISPGVDVVPTRTDLTDLTDLAALLGPADPAQVHAGVPQAQGDVLVWPWTPDQAPSQSGDYWTITLEGQNAGDFTDMSANILDGDADGFSGGDYTSRWRVQGADTTPPTVRSAVGSADGGIVIVFSEPILASNVHAGLDVWVANAYGVTVAEAHNLQPIWIIPVLTLALIAWTAMVVTLTKPKSRV